LPNLIFWVMKQFSRAVLEHEPIQALLDAGLSISKL